MPISDQCGLCKNYLAFGKCLAFLDEIPDEIFNGFFDHTNPYEGDGGIRWEPWPQDQENNST